ncbi:hypothetical protein A4A49_56392, partial [Nicotiana attenuata]
FFTEEQYLQLLKMLNQANINTNTPTDTAAHAKVTGIPLSLLSMIKENRWIIDSGATNHMVSSLHLYIDYMELSESNSRKVQLPTGETSVITHLGTSSILDNIVIKNVLFIPRFRYNLLSVSKLTKDLGLFLAFFPACCIFQDICNGKVKGIGRFSARAVTAVFLGYSLTQKGYKLFDLTNRVVFVSRDVIFLEDSFPFMQQPGESSPNSTIPFTDQDHNIPVADPDALSPTTTFPNDDPSVDVMPIDPSPPNIQEDMSLNSPIDTVSPTSHSMNSPTLSTIDTVMHSPAPLPQHENNLEPQHENNFEPRRSSRTSRPPIWMQDYV